MNRRHAAALLCTALMSVAGHAQATTKQECADAYVEGQRARKEGRLLSAQEQLLICSQGDCPGAIRGECTTWLDEVRSAIPTVVVAAKDRWGDETFAVQVYVDGQLLRETLDGTGIPVDPGAHTFRFEASGETPIEQQLLVRAGEQNRRIDVNFTPPKVERREHVERPPQRRTQERELELNPLEPSNLPWVLGGIGTASLVGSALFWISAESSLGDLEDSGCAPSCSEQQADSVTRQRVIGDVLFVLGLASLGTAAYLLLTDSPEEPPPRAAVDFSPLAGGGMATLNGSF